MDRLESIPIKLVNIGDRLRGLDEGQVLALMESIKEVGLINPVLVYPRRIMGDDFPAGADGYELITGAHRLEAYKRLGHSEILARIVKKPGDSRDGLLHSLMEVDENLCGPWLSNKDRIRFLQRRKDIYIALHPETRLGASQAAGMNRALGRGGQVVRDVESNVVSFAKETAQRTGRSERDIRRDVERGEKIKPSLFDKIDGTALDTGKYLDQLKRLPMKEQEEKVKHDLALQGEVPRKYKISDDEIQFQRLRRSWKESSPKAQRKFLDWVNRPPKQANGAAAPGNGALKR